MPGLDEFLRNMFGGGQPQPQAAPPMNAMPPQAGGMAQPPGMFGQLQQWNEANPGVLASIGAGMMQGNMGAGLEQAGKYRTLAVSDQKDRAEKTNTKNLTRQWLLKKGMSEADADAAMANPTILASMLKPEKAEGTDDMREYEYAKANGFGGSFVDWQTKKAGGTSNDYDARAAAAARFGLKEGDPAYQGYMLTGKMPREDQQDMSATEMKELWKSEDEIPVIDNTISSLKRAKDLNKKTFTGYSAGLRGEIGTKLPGGSLLVDGEAAQATSEFNKIMSMEAIQNMASTLKGATTDSELARFVSILADPTADPDIRERTIDRMIQLSERVKDVKSKRIQSIKGPVAQGAEPAQGTGGNKTSSGVSWSIEP